ncbi:MAG: RNA 2',3'-cyclic phosphodiesterase, partial [Planctomycetota bacterium]
MTPNSFDRKAGGLRLFVAVPLPPVVLTQAAAIIARLAERSGRVRWSDPRRLHLTLAFLGDAVSEGRVPAIAAAIDEACRGIPPLVVGCGGLGRFPAAGRPRVVWLGVADGAADLIRLHEAVAQRLEPLGFQREARGWLPHVTLGRLPGHGRS